jgi:hypothetical protein
MWGEGGGNCSQEPADVFAFWTQLTVAPKSLIRRHSYSAEGLFVSGRHADSKRKGILAGLQGVYALHFLHV